MRAPPSPGTAHDTLEIGKLRPPIELAFDFLRASDQHARIAGTARRLLGGNRMLGHPADGFDDFANAEAAAVSEIVDQLLLIAKGVEHQQVCASEIAHMNIVADAAPVGSGVISAVNGNVVSLPQ